MDMKKRVRELEKAVTMDVTLEPKSDRELTEWFKANPGFHPYAQTDDDIDIMPKHLRLALNNRMDHFMQQHDLHNLADLAKFFSSNPSVPFPF